MQVGSSIGWGDRPVQSAAREAVGFRCHCDGGSALIARGIDFILLAVSARLAHGDLVAAARALKGESADQGHRFILIKHLLLSCANVRDLEEMGRPLHKTYPELVEIVRPHQKSLEFTKYLKNIAVGHVHPALCRKAIKSQPDFSAILTSAWETVDVHVGFTMLETAINAYVHNGRHRLFKHRIDLNNPSDMARFLEFLGETVQAGATYCARLGAIAVLQAKLPIVAGNVVQQARQAGLNNHPSARRRSSTPGSRARATAE